VQDQQEQVRALADEEFERFMLAVPEQYRLFARFMCETGLRISEAAELRWRDVDLAALRLSVSRRYREGRVAAPKSRAGVRSLPLSPELARLLWQHRKAAGNAADAALVWPGRDGKHLDATSVARWCRKAAATAGVTCTPHVWRHTCITNLLRHGLSVKQAQVWAGHANPGITLAVYADAMAGAVDASPFGGGNQGGNQVGTSGAETGRNADALEPAESAQLRAVSS
jgi:integrase